MDRSSKSGKSKIPIYSRHHLANELQDNKKAQTATKRRPSKVATVYQTDTGNKELTTSTESLKSEKVPVPAIYVEALNAGEISSEVETDYDDHPQVISDISDPKVGKHSSAILDYENPRPRSRSKGKPRRKNKSPVKKRRRKKVARVRPPPPQSSDSDSGSEVKHGSRRTRRSPNSSSTMDLDDIDNDEPSSWRKTCKQIWWLPLIVVIGVVAVIVLHYKTGS